MSVHFVCMVDFFKRRISPQLGLSLATEIKSGSTYLLCGDLAEVPELVHSQNDMLCSMSEGGKVQIFVCKDNNTGTKAANPVAAENDRVTTEVETGSNAPSSSVRSRTMMTSSSDLKIKQDRDAQLKYTPIASLNPTDSSVLQPSGSNMCAIKQETNTAGLQSTILPKPEVGIVRNSSLPPEELRRELKLAILQRRREQGKQNLDWKSVEQERQKEINSITLTETDLEKRTKRRASNNRAAQKCREKRKLQEDCLLREVKRLRDHKSTLSKMVSTLEMQQSLLREMFLSGKDPRAITSDPKTKGLLREILSRDVVIPEFSRSSAADEDISSSIFVSSSECNSDDTRNGFDFESSQETTDSVAGNEYTELTREYSRGARDLRTPEMKTEAINEVSNFKEVRGHSQSHSSENDSDVELIELEKPLIIDID